MTEDGLGINKLMDLNMLKFFIFCMERTDNDENYNLSIPISVLNFEANWNGRKTFDSNSNTAIYNGQLTNAAKLFKSFINIAESENHYLNMIDRERLIDSSLIHEVQFAPDGLDFEFSETNVIIRHEFFDYKETICVSPIISKKSTIE